MKVNKILGDALTPLNLGEVSEGEHSGSTRTRDARYFTFQIMSLPGGHSDDGPTYIRQLVTLHYFCPRGTDTDDINRRIAWALFKADFTWPSVLTRHGEDGIDVMFECEYLEGVPDDPDPTPEPQPPEPTPDPEPEPEPDPEPDPDPDPEPQPDPDPDSDPDSDLYNEPEYNPPDEEEGGTS